jgi:hypothetical protein
MKKIFNDLFTGIDGKTHDPSRWLWIIGIVCFLSFAGYEVYKNGHFDMTNFGIAYSALLGGGAAAVKIKETTEPKGE